jgi:hypothetical protein
VAEYGEQSAEGEKAYEDSNAEERYLELTPQRQPYLDEARACSELTIPRLIQPEGSNGSELATTAQDDGARCVNGLAANIVLTNLPPNQPVVRFETDEVLEGIMDSQSEDPETKAKLDKSAREARKYFDRIARETLKITAIKGHRAVFYEGSKHLVCGGNVLYWRLDDKANFGKIRAVPLARYVCLRDSLGFPLEIIVRDGLSAANLPPNLKEILYDRRSPGEILRDASLTNTDSPQISDLALYTYCCWKPEREKYEFHQCFKGVVVEGSKALYSVEDCPLLPMTFNLADGESYGRGHVEESRGVLMALEALAQAETATSIALSEFRLLIGGGSALRARDIMNTEPGSPLDAEPGSITALSYGKAGDLQSIRESMAMKQRLLGIKFGDYLAVQRNAERVTAEEWKTLTLALDRTLGGNSSGIASVQAPWYAHSLLLTLKHEQPEIEIPDGRTDAIHVKLLTGFDALGRNFEFQQFIEGEQVIVSLIGEAEYAKRSNVDALADKIHGYQGIEAKGLMKTDEQMQQIAAQEQQRQENLAAVPQIISAYGQAATKGQPPQ